MDKHCKCKQQKSWWNKSIIFSFPLVHLKEISPGCSLEVLMLKLKLQYFGHLMWRADSFEKTWCWERLKAGGEGDDRGWKGWMPSPTQWTWACCRCPAGDGEGQGSLACCTPWGHSQTGLSDWTTTMGEGRIPPHSNIELTSTTTIMLFSSSFLYS